MQLLHAKMALLVRKRLSHIIEHVLTPFPRYIADYVYALPTIAFFLSGLGMFIIGHLISSQMLGYRKFRGPLVWQKSIALIRYLSYRGFHIKTLRWNSAPVGVLLLGAVGAVYFCCELRIHDVLSRGSSLTISSPGMDLVPQPYYWSSEDFGGSPPLGTRSGWMALACMPFVLYVRHSSHSSNILTLTVRRQARQTGSPSRLEYPMRRFKFSIAGLRTRSFCLH
jgi:hypothetical protein